MNILHIRPYIELGGVSQYLIRLSEGLTAHGHHVIVASAGGELSADDLMANAEAVGTAILVVVATPDANPNVMRGLIDQLRKSSDKPIAVLLGSTQDDKVVLVGGLSHALVERGLSAGAWVGDTAKLVGGGGGGRPDMAQAGGKDPEKLPAALEQAKAAMRAKLATT